MNHPQFNNSRAKFTALKEVILTMKNLVDIPVNDFDASVRDDYKAITKKMWNLIKKFETEHNQEISQLVARLATVQPFIDIIQRLEDLERRVDQGDEESDGDIIQEVVIPNLNDVQLENV
jgi:hypothetical protein